MFEDIFGHDENNLEETEENNKIKNDPTTNSGPYGKNWYELKNSEE